MKDPYLEDDYCVERLVSEWKKYGSIAIAFDFDDTVYDFHQKGRTYDKVIKLLKLAKEKGATLIVWTGNPNLNFVSDYLESYGISPDFYNESPVETGKARKIYANLYLDDRAGLSSAVNILEKTISKL